MQREEFEKLVVTLRPKVVSVGRQFFGNEDDAEDVAQEVMMHLWTLRDRIDPRRGSTEGLVTRVATNYCINLLRHREPLRPLDAVAPPATAPDSAMEDEEARKWLAQRMEALPEAWRRLLRMNQEDGLTAAEIARVTGLKEKSVKVMMARARKRLLDETRKRWKI